jgi:hypothetical protein
MGDEVTKKDLWALQKKIDDVAKRVEKSEGAIAVLKDVPTKQDDAIAEAYNARCSALEKRCAELAARIAALEKG